MTLLERVLYRLRMLRIAFTVQPIAGGAEEKPGDKDDKDSDDDSDDAKDDDDTDEKDDSDDKDDDKDSAEAGLRRQLAEARKREREASKKLKKAEEQKAKDEGKWKELAEQREREKQEAEAKLAKAERRGAVEKVAKRLGFADPDDAIRNLDAEVDADDTAAIERELKDVLERKPHLKEDEGSGSGPVRTKRRSAGKPDMDKLIRQRAGR